MKHLVIGAGNLGLDLQKEILARGEECAMLTRSLGFNYPPNTESVDYTLPFDPDHIWCTIGAGSVDEANKDFVPFVDLHVKLPIALTQAIKEKETRLHLFSTDYLCEYENEKSRSLYALSKKMMEDAVMYLPNELKDRIHIWRVGSLYGKHKPLKTFPGKIMKALKEIKKPISLPENGCFPTPTAWLAKRLLDLKDSRSMYNHYFWLGPKTKTSSYDWAVEMFGEKKFSGKRVDHDRPFSFNYNFDSEDEPTWLDLWNEYGPATLAAAERELANEKA